MNALHTSGPWKVETLGGTIRVTVDEAPDNNSDIAILGDCRVPREQSNAALIAAAPELLAACKMWLDGSGTDAIGATRKAVAKAEGRQP